MDQNKLIKFLLLWIANSLLLLIFATLFVNDIVLGNAIITKPMSSVLVGLILTLLISLVPQASKKLDLKMKDGKILTSAYFVVDLVSIWIIKRFADITGFGVSNILWVVILAIFAALMQVGVEKYSSKFLKISKVS